MKEISAKIENAEKEGVETYGIIIRLIRLGILAQSTVIRESEVIDEYLYQRYRHYFGFVKNVKLNGRWYKDFVPVVMINHSNRTVAWHAEINSHEKVLAKLIQKYMEKNQNVVSQVGSVMPPEPPQQPIEKRKY